MTRIEPFIVFLGVAAVAATLLSCGGNEQSAEPTPSAVAPVGRPNCPSSGQSKVGY